MVKGISRTVTNLVRVRENRKTEILPSEIYSTYILLRLRHVHNANIQREHNTIFLRSATHPSFFLRTTPTKPSGWPGRKGAKESCVWHISTWQKTSSRKFVIRISWKKFVCIPKFCGNFNEILGKLWNIRFWGTFSYILKRVWGNRNQKFWENIQIFENSEKI